MLRKFTSLIALLGLVAVVSPSLAAKPTTLELPEQASQVAENIFYLGTAQDPSTGQVVEGYAIVHPKAKPARGGNVRPSKPGGDKCYGFIASGAKWKTIEPWVMNPANPDNLNANTLYGIIEAGIGKWESASGNTNILGSGSQTGADLSAGYGTLNSVNEVYFGELGAGTIGVTILWGYWSGPPASRQIVEWDQVYNTYYDWSAEALGVPNKMDFDNIATHELGHSFGMDDIYSTGCTAVTMYGYGDYAQTDKRSLESADITGINALY